MGGLGSQGHSEASLSDSRLPMLVELTLTTLTTLAGVTLGSNQEYRSQLVICSLTMPQ